MDFMNKLERKFGRFAIPRLTIVLLVCYVAGYILEIVAPEFLSYLTLNPYEIMHGQVWRLVSWILIPPPTSIYFVIIMLLFYYSIGTQLEITWGAFQYNLYIFGGMFFTVIGSFVFYFISYAFNFRMMSIAPELYFEYMSHIFSTYYINLSIYLAYAVTFPNAQVLLMFIFPVRMKWLAIVEVIILAYDILSAFRMGMDVGVIYSVVIGSSLLNFIIFFFTTRKYIRRSKAQQRYRNETKKIKRQSANHDFNGIIKHKCTICGKTDKDDENMTFRYCSKCEGNYEFCQEHLYTHIHFEKNQNNT